MLKTRVKNYILPSHLNVRQARILMLGPIGAGKSSFFNTIKSILKGQICQQAIAGTEVKSLTRKFRIYTMGKDLNFCLCDTCGLEHDGRPDLADINYILEGNVPDKYEFSGAPIRPSIPDFISEPGLKDKVHCVAFIFDATKVKVTKVETWNKFTEVKSRLNSMDIPAVILLTHIDRLEPILVDDVSKVFLSKEVKRVTEFVSLRLGVPSGDVMPIKNYESEINCQDDISCLALQALDRMLSYAKDFLDN